MALTIKDGTGTNATMATQVVAGEHLSKTIGHDTAGNPVDLVMALEMLARALDGLSMSVDPASSRLRVMLDAAGGAQTLGTVTTVTTVSTVTNMSLIGGRAADQLVPDMMTVAWGETVRRCVA